MTSRSSDFHSLFFLSFMKIRGSVFSQIHLKIRRYLISRTCANSLINEMSHIVEILVVVINPGIDVLGLVFLRRYGFEKDRGGI